jgi:hypothetical protein
MDIPRIKYLSFTSIKHCSCRIARGAGLPSVIHHEWLGILPTLCDAVDMRHASALALPFYLLEEKVLPFRRKSFVSGL